MHFLKRDRAYIGNGLLYFIIAVSSSQLSAECQVDSSLERQVGGFDNIAYAEENVAERIRQIYTRHSYEQQVTTCPETIRPVQLWLGPFAEKVRQYGNEHLAGYKERFAGVTAAGDYRLRRWMFSGGFSYAVSEVRVPHRKVKASFRTYAGSIGAVWSNTKWFADAILSYLYSPIDARRNISEDASGIALQKRLRASHSDHSNQGLVHIGGGYNYRVPAGSKGTVKLYPFFNLDYLFIYQDGYTEKGAENLDLKIDSKKYDLFRPEGGAGIGYHGCFKSLHVMADISASYVLEFRYTGKKTHAHFEDDTCRFTLDGLNPENNVICPAARLRLATPSYGFSITLGYHGEFGSRFTENAVEAELRKAF